MNLQKRLPDLASVVQVYAVVAVMFAGWTITSFLWKLSAWLLLLNLGEVLTIFSYALAANFVESLVVLLLLLVVCLLVPAPVLRDDFVVRGTILATGLIGSLIAFVGSQMLFGIESGLLLLSAPLGILLGMSLLLWRALDSRRLRSLVLLFSDRVIVFLIPLLPLFGGASLYVIVRNIG